MSNKREMIPQHEPLRVPQGWGEPGRSFIIQLERILTDIYRWIRNLSSAKQDKTLNYYFTGVQVSSGYVSVDYPENHTISSHIYMVQPLYLSAQGAVTGWTATMQLMDEHIIIYIRQGSSVPTDGSKVSFRLVCIPV